MQGFIFLIVLNFRIKSKCRFNFIESCQKNLTRIHLHLFKRVRSLWSSKSPKTHLDWSAAFSDRVASKKTVFLFNRRSKACVDRLFSSLLVPFFRSVEQSGLTIGKC